jgi:hypothetical protein
MRPVRASRNTARQNELVSAEGENHIFCGSYIKTIREERRPAVLDLNIAVSDVH